MASTPIGGNHEPITGINVTPLVDVMLVLLIIFMVTATYIVNQAINVELPKAATGEESRSTNLAFVIDKDSQLFLDGKSITFEDLAPRLTELKNQGVPLQALIGADKATPHGTVVRLVDLLRQNGLVDFALNVKTEK
jgi:biopolymer transport protein ExbD